MTAPFLGEFITGSPLHLACLAGGLGVVLATVLLMRCSREAGGLPWLRYAIGYGCLLVWLVNTAYWCWPVRFHWDGSLPLHFCNLANLIGALAVLARWRGCQALLYFWAFALCVWAFLTPTVQYGASHPAFWIFWIYHLFIFLAVAQVLVADRFRPRGRDLRFALVATGGYASVLVLLNLAMGWDYGFLGAGDAGAPTPLDFLGPYPWSIVWLYLGVALAFAVLMVPFWIVRWRRAKEGLSPRDKMSDT